MAADPQEADDAEIRARAVKLLARREHAPAELAHKLTERGYPRSAVQRVLDTLIDENLLSERRYAESVAHFRAQRGYGPQRIRAELGAKGVAEAGIDEALATVEVDWAASARAERRRRFGDAVPEDFTSKAKQMRFLQRRGFTTEQIRAAVDD